MLVEGKRDVAADAVRAQCSNPAMPFPTDNKAAENFCGNGFSFFDWEHTPITEYCVERLADAPSQPPKVRRYDRTTLVLLVVLLVLYLVCY